MPSPDNESAPPRPTIHTITVADPPEAWRACGFTVGDDDICVVSRVRIHLTGRDAGKRITGWSLRDSGQKGDELDGLTTTVAAGPLPGASPEHANGVTSIDHIVLLTPNQQRTIGALQSVGLLALRTRNTDQYGAPFLQTFFRAGEVIVELIGPEEPSSDDPAGFFGLAFTVADLDATAAFLGPDGVGAAKDAVQPGRRIATLRHKHFGVSVATAFMSPEPS